MAISHFSAFPDQAPLASARSGEVGLYNSEFEKDACGVAMVATLTGQARHDIVALVIDPGHADVWDGPGILRGIAEIVVGAVKGKSPDLGTRGQAEL